MKIKLYRELSFLSRKEMQRFHTFVSSPYFNQHTDTILYLESLQPFHPIYNVNDNLVFRAIFPEQPFDGSKLRVLRTYLLKLLDQFYIQAQLEDDPLSKEKLLINGFMKREMYDFAQRKVDQAIKEINTEQTTDFETAERSLYLEQILLDLNLMAGRRTSALEEDRILPSLDRLFLAKRFKFLMAIENSRQMLATGAEPSGIWETLTLAERTGVLESPLVAIYHLLLMILIQPANNQLINQLYEIVQQYHSKIPQADLYNILSILINKFMLDLRKGISGSLRKAFTNYQRMHELKVIYGMGNTTIHLIRNIVSAGARLHEFQWTTKFLQEARKQIPQEHRHQVFHFGSAQMAFHQNNYPEAKKHLLEVEFEDPMVKISASNLLLKCYFETQETEVFFSLQESMRRYLNRKQELKDSYRQAYLNFLTIVGHLYDLQWDLGSKYNAVQLKIKLDEYESFFNRDWVQEKLVRL